MRPAARRRPGRHPRPLRRRRVRRQPRHHDDEMTPAQWSRDIDVNLTGAFRVIQACLPGMRERGYGRIVVLSSIAAVAGLSGQVAYAASKAGLLGLVKTVAAENAGRGITAN